MNKQYKKILLLTGIGLIISLILKGAKKMNTTVKVNTSKFSKFKTNEILKLSMIEQALIDTGFTGDVLNYALSALLFETGRFTGRSKVAELNNNLTGIKWLNKKYQIAEKGSPVPIKEKYSNPNNPLNFYAKFKSFEDWAKDYKRILSFGAKPINATSVEDYVERLHKNKYFPKNPEQYTAGVKSYYNMLVL